MNKITFLFILSISTFLVSCQKCANCTLVTHKTISNDSTEREYCGQVLKDIENTPSYKKNGIEYEWICEDK